MEFQILDLKNNVVATAKSAQEARTKYRAGRGPFGRQTILDPVGATITESELEDLCQTEIQEEEADRA